MGAKGLGFQSAVVCIALIFVSLSTTPVFIILYAMSYMDSSLYALAPWLLGYHPPAASGFTFSELKP
jgi:hypothetical protein